MSFCKVGEKAYLRVNNSEVWRFDGPIDVSVISEEEITYPNLWIHEFWFGAWGVNGFGRVQFDAYVYQWGAWIPRIGYWYTLGGKGGFPGWIQGKLWDSSNLRLVNGSPDSYSLNPPNNLDRTGSVSSKNLDGPIAPRVLEFYPPRPIGHNQSPIVKSRYKLLVNGNVIRISSDPIDYTVRCGDRCPPGEKWSEKCNACVCEGMDGILADLRGATAMARQLRNKA